MSEIIKNIFISGQPGSGKTTLLKEIIKELKLNAGGFYTKEIREKGQRVGFTITSLDGRRKILAHKNFQSNFKVGEYGVNIKGLEEIGVKSILQALKENKLIIIDEVGNMEMKSENFKKAVLAALNSKNKVLGTIKLTLDSFTGKIKKRVDTKIFYLTRENRQKIKEKILQLLSPDIAMAVFSNSS